MRLILCCIFNLSFVNDNQRDLMYKTTVKRHPGWCSVPEMHLHFIREMSSKRLQEAVSDTSHCCVHPVSLIFITELFFFFNQSNTTGCFETKSLILRFILMSLTSSTEHVVRRIVPLSRISSQGFQKASSFKQTFSEEFILRGFRCWSCNTM